MILSIGQLAKASDVKIPTIRFYETIGLLPPADRATNDRRIYTEAAVRRLSFIRNARALGFSVDAIRDLLALSEDPGGDCETANHLAKQQLQDVETKLARLQTLKAALRRMVDADCRGPVADCRVIESLADEALA